MNDGNMRLHRRKQIETAQRNALLRTMIRHFENMITDLDGQIATEKDRTGIKDTAHPAYSTFAKAAAKRRQKVLTSVAHVKSLLEVGNRELDEVAMQPKTASHHQHLLRNSNTFPPLRSVHPSSAGA
jgi:flagellar protein FliJ